MSAKDVFPPRDSRRSFFKRRNSCGHEIDGNHAGRTCPVQSGEKATSSREFARFSERDESFDKGASRRYRFPPRTPSVIPPDSRSDVNLERNTRLGRCRGGVAFLRGVYRVRMRGMPRSFAYILKRRTTTATAPNMPARREKRRGGREKEREREREGGRVETKISVSRLCYPVAGGGGGGGGGEEGKNGRGKRGARGIKRRSECLECAVY